ncbi:type II secretion system protein GspK [Caulobacter soli]|uniref:type II secretion system protein GspK n=1 Tax=Caulobacter soli TaxID=2708539 RepID=UPI0013EA201B|nr:type II secretion system protein GspK [Caulobacter soli]
MLIFSYIAFAVLAADRGALAGADAAMRTARLEAAADAGLATAVHGLGAESAAARWSADGRPRRLDLGGAEVTMTIEDERGKASLNSLTETQWRRLFQAGGASGARLDRLVDSAMDWRDNGERVDGGLLYYARRGVRPRWSAMRTVGELAELDGMDPALLARIAPSLTLFWGASGAFEARNADPLAMSVMSSSDSGGVDTIIRQRELAGQRTALEAGSVSYVGRPVTVRIVARDTQGGVFRRAAIIEFTGRRDTPYWLRALD